MTGRRDGRSLTGCPFGSRLSYRATRVGKWPGNLQSVQFAGIVAQHQVGQLEGSSARNLAIPYHGGQGDGQRLARSVGRDPAGFLPSHFIRVGETTLFAWVCLALLASLALFAWLFYAQGRDFTSAMGWSALPVIGMVVYLRFCHMGKPPGPSIEVLLRLL